MHVASKKLARAPDGAASQKITRRREQNEFSRSGTFQITATTAIAQMFQIWNISNDRDIIILKIWGATAPLLAPGPRVNGFTFHYVARDSLYWPKILSSAAHRQVCRARGTTSKLSAKGREFNFGRRFSFLAFFGIFL